MPQGPSPEAVAARAAMQADLKKSAESYDKVIKGADGVLQVYKDAGNWVAEKAAGFEELATGGPSDRAVQIAQANAREVEALASDKNVTYTHVKGNEYRKLEGPEKSMDQRKADDAKLAALFREQVKGRISTLDEQIKAAGEKGEDTAALEAKKAELQKMEKLELDPSKATSTKEKEEYAKAKAEVVKMTKNLGYLKAHNEINKINGKMASAAGALEDGLIIGAQVVANIAAPGVGGLIIGEAMATAEKGGAWKTKRLDGKEHKGAIAAVITGQPVKWDDILETGLNAIPVPGGSAAKEPGKAVVKEGVKAVTKEGVKAVEKEVVKALEKEVIKAVEHEVAKVAEKQVVKALEKQFGKQVAEKLGKVMEHKLAKTIADKIKGKTADEVKKYLKEEVPKLLKEMTGNDNLNALLGDIGPALVPPATKTAIKAALDGAGISIGGPVTA
ncbi:MAG: hypothetical protein EBV03_08105, partial [Proteobacteria bacterium]|nr:hypothetical protein [Pseudomonadota bacterium]